MSATGKRARRMLADLTAILNSMDALAEANHEKLAGLGAATRASAGNLLHYLALRREDLRRLQIELTDLGLSSLGRSEAHVRDAVARVVSAVRALAGLPAMAMVGNSINRRHAAKLLTTRSHRLFGPLGKNGAHIMVTLPSSAATDRALIARLLDAGMTLARINCAHDEAHAWLAMIANIRRTSRVSGRPCRILVDLAGPKLRTGPLAPGPNVLHLRCPHDGNGVAKPTHIRLVAESEVLPEDAIPIPVDFLALLKRDDRIELEDQRGKQRSLTVVSIGRKQVVATLRQSVYLAQGSPLHLVRRGQSVARSSVGTLPEIPSVITLVPGEHLLLTRDGEGLPARRNAHDRVIAPARIACQLPEALSQIRVGDRVLFDDGRIDGTVVRHTSDGLNIRITRTPGASGKLRASHGINLPDTALHLPHLTDEDRENLKLLAKHADLIGISFVRGPAVVGEVRTLLKKMTRRQPGLVLKIETSEGFARLPSILLAGLHAAPLAVLLARGDLAVEVGFERLAEVQEEILWLCEAAHIPVIWGTQVLETLVKKHLPTRAEVTDAAMSSRAECVMLNKGPYVTQCRSLNAIS